ncbi:hypothetical protein [Nodosilinea nodulosa]|nr:hypothetical protein [Nodosilinea nodulosa]
MRVAALGWVRGTLRYRRPKQPDILPAAVDTAELARDCCGTP